MTMPTLNLAGCMSFDGEYDDSRHYVQGRQTDKSFSVTMKPSA